MRAYGSPFRKASASIDMKDLTANARKAAERVRKRNAGLVPVEVWIHHTNREKLKRVAVRLERPSKAAP